MQFGFCLLKYYYSYEVNEIICFEVLHKDLCIKLGYTKMAYCTAKQLSRRVWKTKLLWSRTVVKINKTEKMLVRAWADWLFRSVTLVFAFRRVCESALMSFMTRNVGMIKSDRKMKKGIHRYEMLVHAQIAINDLVNIAYIIIYIYITQSKWRPCAKHRA